jgi:ribosome maturation factor RimP
LTSAAEATDDISSVYQLQTSSGGKKLKLKKHVTSSGGKKLKLKKHVTSSGGKKLKLKKHVTSSGGKKLKLKTHVIYCVGFEVLTAVVMKSNVFWDIMPCSPLKVNRRFGGISPPSSGSKNKPALLATSFHSGILLGIFFDHEDGGDMFLRNVS